MLFHVSLEADQPQQVATAVAEIFGGKALPFPPVGIGSWMAFAGDDRGTIIEFYQRGTELHEAGGEADTIGVQGNVRRHGPVHVAIATPLAEEAVYAVATREGWPVKTCNRDGKFHVIEVRVEGCQLIEVLTAEMQREYLAAVTIDNWEAMLATPVAA